MLVFSINVKELLALYMWLDSSGKNIKVCCVTWRVDNNSALQAIKNQGSSKAWPLCCLSVNILRKANSRNIIIDPVSISSEENILPDSANRNRQVPDWSLADNLAQKMFTRWRTRTPDVDLMAQGKLHYITLGHDIAWTLYNLPYCWDKFWPRSGSRSWTSF